MGREAKGAKRTDKLAAVKFRNIPHNAEVWAVFGDIERNSCYTIAKFS